MFNCSTNGLCPIRIATNGSTSLLNENFQLDSIQLFPERLSGKVYATILKGIVGGFEFSFFQRNLKELARKAMEMCLRVLKESNKSRFDSYSRQEQCIDHITYYLSGLSRAHFFRQPFSKQLYTIFPFLIMAIQSPSYLFT